MAPTPRKTATALTILNLMFAAGGAHAATPASRPPSMPMAGPVKPGAYRFLVSDLADGGVLYTATAGALAGLRLPLSFRDSANYWGRYVCGQPGTDCAVVDRYDAAAFTVLPERSPAGELQTERTNIHQGTSLYDAATWQIAVTLGAVATRQAAGHTLAGAQNRLLAEGHDGEALQATRGANRAVTRDGVFRYGGRSIIDPQQAYMFRMVARSWLATDPLADSPFATLITTRGLPVQDPRYRPGRISWTDWKPITGENAWAFLLGPLQAARLEYLQLQQRDHVPFGELAVQNALAVLPAFAAMQSPLGGVWYAPEGTIANQGEQPVDPYFVAVENCFSLYAGLRVLDVTLAEIDLHAPGLASEDRTRLAEARAMIRRLLHGEPGGTRGLREFFRQQAWQDGEFVQGGVANDPRRSGSAWIPARDTRAVDVNTWGVASLGPAQIDEWFGFGAAHRVWTSTKRWGGYGSGRTLWGVGFSNRDGNGIGADGLYRQGVMSGEWTAGAILMVRSLARHYEALASETRAAARDRAAARAYVAELRADEQSMLIGLEKLRLHAYPSAGFAGMPPDYASLMGEPQLAASAAGRVTPYLYASRRYFVPFGWFANPLPSTCTTAWVVMLEHRFDPFTPVAARTAAAPG